MALGVVTTVMLYLVGFPNPVTFGLLTLVLNYIPYIGPAIVALVLFGVGVVAMPSLAHAALAPALFVAIATVEGHFITPSIVGRRLTISPFLVFLALAFWTWLWGPIGAFLAMPLLIMSFVVLGHLLPREEGTCRDKRSDQSSETRWNFFDRPRVPAGRSRSTQWPLHRHRPRRRAHNGTTPGDIEKQLETIRNDISELTHQVADLISQTKDEVMAQVKAQARSAKAQADSVLSDAKETGPRGGRRVPRRRGHVRRRDRGFARSAGPTRRSRWSPASASCSAPPGGAERRRGQSVQNLLATLRAEFRSRSRRSICSAVAASPARSAAVRRASRSSCGLSDNYGTLQACLAMAAILPRGCGDCDRGAAFCASEARKRAAKRAEKERLEKEEAAKNAPPTWMDPALSRRCRCCCRSASRRCRSACAIAAIAGGWSVRLVGWGLLRERGTAAEEDAAAEQPAE